MKNNIIAFPSTPPFAQPRKPGALSHVAEPFRSLVNDFVPSRCPSPETPACAESAPCPSCKTTQMHCVGRCEYCKVQFCLDCVSLAAGFPVCRSCATKMLADYRNDIAELQRAVEAVAGCLEAA